MKKALLSITALGFLFCGLTMATAENTLLAERALKSTVALNLDDGKQYGSGFFVGHDLVATNLHVVHGATIGKGKQVGTKNYSFKFQSFVAIDEARDLIILKVSNSSDITSTPLTLGDSEAMKIGETIYAVGNPLGFEGTFSQGNISGIRKDNNGKLFQMTAPISAGSSGGPVLNKKGDVIGISMAGHDNAQNLNWAIPASYLDSLLANIGKPQFLWEVIDKMEMSGFDWLDSDSEYPSYQFTLKNVRRQDALNVYCLIIFQDENDQLIGLDPVQVPEISAKGNPITVTRRSIFEAHYDDESMHALLRLLGIFDPVEQAILSASVIFRVRDKNKNFEDYNLLNPHVKKLYDKVSLKILSFDMRKSISLPKQ